jgi:hypothetical protein
MSYALMSHYKCLPERERENFNYALFAFAFSPGDKIENCSAQFLGLGEVDANNPSETAFLLLNS